MKIYQVEELVGITKKNIRFYEDEGLLCPERDPQNGYRDYTIKDVRQLEKIKLLRKLSVPIEEIRFLQAGKVSFAQCMEKQIGRLAQEQKKENRSDNCGYSFLRDNGICLRYTATCCSRRKRDIVSAVDCFCYSYLCHSWNSNCINSKIKRNFRRRGI